MDRCPDAGSRGPRKSDCVVKRTSVVLDVIRLAIHSHTKSLLLSGPLEKRKRGLGSTIPGIPEALPVLIS